MRRFGYEVLFLPASAIDDPRVWAGSEEALNMPVWGWWVRNAWGGDKVGEYVLDGWKGGLRLEHRYGRDIVCCLLGREGVGGYERMGIGMGMGEEEEISFRSKLYD